MNILIVGAKGFIGSHCVEYFSKTDNVWQCDVLNYTEEKNYFQLIPGSVDFDEIFSRIDIDCCINCSGAANVPVSLDKPLFDFNLNTFNVILLLEAIRKFRPNCKFITMSSAAVYGNPVKLPIKTSDLINPVSPYGFHKVMAENLCKEYYNFWGIKTCCLRVFSTYGPGLSKQLFWDMYNKIISNDILELWGTGKESRDFIYIKDLIRVIKIIIDKGSFEASVYNAANGNQVTIETVAKSFISLLGVNKEIQFNNKVRKGDPLNWEADVSDIINLGYAPQYTIEEGMIEFIEWINNRKDE